MKKKICIGLIFAMIIVLFSFGWFFKKEESNGVVWNGKQTIQTKNEQSFISIPGFDKMVFESNTTKQKVNIHNPETNTCMMNFSIEMQDGTSIWSAENIYPGYGLYDIEINNILERGTYENCIFSIRCFKDNVEINGCNISFILYVN